MEIRCVCPPKADGSPRHDHDEITLKEHLSFGNARAVRNALALDAAASGRVDFAEVLGTISERFVMYGIESWTIVDEKNKPVDVSIAAIEQFIFADYDVAALVADEADGRFQDAVLGDLIRKASESLPSMSTNGSTSAHKASRTRTAKSSSRSSTRQKPSSPSSITTIPTAATETTSNALGGGSSISPKSTTAA